jgi:hypothetical protein
MFRRLLCAVASAAALLFTSLHGIQPAAAAAPSPPFTQCPAIGADTSCALLIVINADGSTNAYSDPSQGPYDGVEDTLVGIVNNSAVTVTSLPLSGPDIFGFDGDGICSGFYPGTPAGCPFGPTGYEGPNTAFTILDSDHGSVDFPAGLAPGANTYFSLEEVVTPGNIVLPVTPTLKADPAIVQVLPGLKLNFPKLIAHLSVNGVPVAGEVINFATTTGKPICSGITGPAGAASCSGSVQAVLSLGLGYTASFGGDPANTPPLLSATAHGTLVTVSSVKIA